MDHKLYSSPNIIRIISSMRIGLAGYVAYMRRREMHGTYCWESQQEKGH
jgi:hypothetical protein